MDHRLVYSGRRGRRRETVGEMRHPNWRTFITAGDAHTFLQRDLEATVTDGVTLASGSGSSWKTTPRGRTADREVRCT